MRMKKMSPIGRRTGKPIVKKNVRTVYDGTENFDDYWTDSSGESRTADESTFVKKTECLIDLPPNSARKSHSNSCKRSLSSLSDATEDEIFSDVTNNSLSLTNGELTNPHKRRITQRDLSIQTSNIFNTPAITKVKPKQLSSLKKRISFKATTPRKTVKSTKGESKNQGFAGEKTWPDKSTNTINLNHEERNIQTLQRNDSPNRSAKQNHISNAIKGNKRILCKEDKTAQRNTNNVNSHKSLQVVLTDANSNPSLSSLPLRKRQSRNRSFAGEKTWINKSINTVNLDNKEQSVQTSQRNSAKDCEINSAPENKSTSTNLDKTSSNIKNNSKAQEILSEKEVAESQNSVKRNSPLNVNKKKKGQNVVSRKDSKTQAERSALSTSKSAASKNSGNESIDDFVTCHGKKEQSATNTISHTISRDCAKIASASNDASEKPGRKQKKFTVNQELNVQSEEELGTRKSKRNRIAPLAHWRNERRKFQIKPTGDITCVGLEKGSEEDRKPIEQIDRRLKQSEKTVDSLRQSFESINENGVCYKPFEDIKSSKSFYKDGKEAYIISKVFSDPSSSVGYLQIAAGCKKEEQYSPTYNICFTIIKGEVDVSLNNKVCRLKTKDFLRVPVGVPYAIDNPGKTKALIFFTTIKPLPEEEKEN